MDIGAAGVVPGVARVVNPAAPGANPNPAPAAPGANPNPAPGADPNPRRGRGGRPAGWRVAPDNTLQQLVRTTANATNRRGPGDGSRKHWFVWRPNMGGLHHYTSKGAMARAEFRSMYHFDQAQLPGAPRAFAEGEARSVRNGAVVVAVHRNHARDMLAQGP